MDFTEKTIQKDYKFRGRIMTVRVDQAELPNGKPCVREVCEHPGGVGVLPIDENGMVTLVRQFRYPYGETILEIPAGKMDHGPENAEACGRRELEEETGYRSENVEFLLSLRTTVAFCDEHVDVYLATDLEKIGEQHLDDAESIDIEIYTLDELCKMIYEGKIEDSKTVAAIMAYGNKVRG